MAELFWPKVRKTPGCWEWTASRLASGYGKLGGKRAGLAHRISWEMANGPIPPGMLVCHHCDNPPCVRPDHLFLGTDSDNRVDMVRKGRAYAQKHPEEFTGERNGNAILTREAADRVRQMAMLGAVSQKEIAAAFGISRVQVSAIKTGRAWA